MRPADAFLSTEDQVKIAIIAAIAVVDVVWIVWAGYSFDLASLTRLVVAVSVVLAVAEIYRRFRPFPKFVVMTRETAWLVAFSGVAAILSNLVVTLNLPVVDAHIVAFDRALGFDWPSYYAYVTSRPWLGLLFTILYVVALPAIALAVIALCAMDRTDRAQELVLAAMIGALIAIAISGLLPSSGGLAWFRPDESLLAHQPVVDLAYKQAFFDLRAGEITRLSLDDIKGLIAFPSYHATLNVLVVLAFRGMRKLFWPLLAFNIAMLMTTPVEGGHHLTDAIAGALVAVLSTWLAALWRRWLGEPDVVQPDSRSAEPLAASASE